MSEPGPPMTGSSDEVGTTVPVGPPPTRYLGADDVIAQVDPMPAGYDLFDDLVLARHPRLRRALLSSRATAWYLQLHWGDGRDLAALDARVRQRQATADDFDDAVLTQLDSLTCRSCAATLRVVRVATGFPHNTTERIRRHAYVDACPHCGELLSALVVEHVDG